MRLRDYDPETYVEDRDNDRRLDNEGDPRGTRAERALEAHVHGEDYRDRYDAEQARKARPVAEPARTMPFDVAWDVRDGQQMYVACCGCTWRITQEPLTTCPAHAAAPTTSEGTQR